MLRILHPFSFIFVDVPRKQYAMHEMPVNIVLTEDLDDLKAKLEAQLAQWKLRTEKEVCGFDC